LVLEIVLNSGLWQQYCKYENSRTVMASGLRMVADMHYLNITNNSTLEGEYKITVEL